MDTRYHVARTRVTPQGSSDFFSFITICRDTETDGISEKSWRDIRTTVRLNSHCSRRTKFKQHRRAHIYESRACECQGISPDSA